MKVGDLVSVPGLLWDHYQLGLVVEPENDPASRRPGHWIQFFEDPSAWRWYGDDDCKIRIVSEVS